MTHKNLFGKANNRTLATLISNTFCNFISHTQNTPRRVDAVPILKVVADKPSMPEVLSFMESTEIWKSIHDYEGYYEISNFGNVRSLDRKLNDHRGYRTQSGKPKKLIKQNMGYHSVSLYKNGIGKSILVHRLVASAFVPNTENKPFVNHKDSNKRNNHYSNLEWCTNKENINHASKNGFMPHGENHYAAKLKDVDIASIRLLYSEGVKQPEIASIFGIGQSHVSRIVNYKTKGRA